jgi:glucan phosphoethanolaminetransferase (alkaline phosphatase superfamily)
LRQFSNFFLFLFLFLFSFFLFFSFLFKVFNLVAIILSSSVIFFKIYFYSLRISHIYTMYFYIFTPNSSQSHPPSCCPPPSVYIIYPGQFVLSIYLWLGPSPTAWSTYPWRILILSPLQSSTVYSASAQGGLIEPLSASCLG